LFTVRCSQRDELQQFLHSKGVATMIHYPVPPHLSEAYAEDRAWPPLPIAENIATTTLSLPLWPQMSVAQVDYVIAQIQEFPGV